ncbi:MAG: S9 family peptidase [Pyrinomonadaceae bacterium]
MKKLGFGLSVLTTTAAIAIFSVSSVLAQGLTVKEIMANPSIAGKRVSGQRLSPDGSKLLYFWNEKGEALDDLYIVDIATGKTSKLLSPADVVTRPEREQKPDPLEYGVVVNDEFQRAGRGGIGNVRWSPDSTGILFTKSGDIFVMPIATAKPVRITKTESFEFSADFLDKDRIIYQEGGNFYAIGLTKTEIVQISSEANPSKNISVFGSTASRDGSMLAYSATDGSSQRPLFVPNYLPYYTAAPSIRRGWTKSKIYATRTDGGFEKAVEIKLPEPEGESYLAGLEWMADNSTLIVDRVDRTHKRRQIFAVPVSEKEANGALIFEETDDKWIGGPARVLSSNPRDASLLLFASESGSGYNHLFSAKIDSTKFSDGKANAEVRQITKGDWEIDWAGWYGNEGATAVYASTQSGTEIRTFGYVDAMTGTGGVIVDNFRGMRDGVSNENGQMVFEGSTWNAPGELYAMPQKICFQCRDIKAARKLTSTTPEAFQKRKWNEPRFFTFKARDGKEVRARAYFPERFNKSAKYPMAIFVHGAGYLQNVINGWNNYYREFMFNQLLTEKGYVVLDIDYRGSAGYGRDWRTDVYDFLGGKDYEDHVDGIDYMVREYNIDRNRIGVYGGSYGGFMAAMLVMRAPESISAAAALRPVMDWKNYYSTNPFYTSQRLGDPKKNPEAYRRSSPIAYAGELRKKLLILHGVLDDNVHVQDSIQLVEQLIRLDKTEYFDLMLYPAERHGFERPTSWEDEYERILALFEKEIGNAARP